MEGDAATLAELVDAYGAHALTLDHLGGIIGQFLGGDARRASGRPRAMEPSSDRQALRLARLLHAYEEHLPAEELALLSRLCLFRRALSKERIEELFLCTPAAHSRHGPRAAGTDRPSAGPCAHPPVDLADLAEAVGRCLEEALTAAPIAGPEGEFHDEILAAADKAREMLWNVSHADLAVIELARLYADAELDVQTDLRPLPAADRDVLRKLSARYLELRSDPLLPFHGKPDPALEQAFQTLGWIKQRPHEVADLRRTICFTSTDECEASSGT